MKSTKRICKNSTFVKQNLSLCFYGDFGWETATNQILNVSLKERGSVIETITGQILVKARNTNMNLCKSGWKTLVVYQLSLGGLQADSTQVESYNMQTRYLGCSGLHADWAEVESERTTCRLYTGRKLQTCRRENILVCNGPTNRLGRGRKWRENYK